MFKLDENDELKILKEFQLSENSTVFKSELSFKRNTLEYGIYKLTYDVLLYANVNSKMKTFKFSVKIFIRIISSGIVVFGLENGLDSKLIGSQQSILFMPSVYSFDIDSLVMPSQLEYKYYCRQRNIANNDPQHFPAITDTQVQDIESGVLSGNCFNSLGNFFP